MNSCIPFRGNFLPLGYKDNGRDFLAMNFCIPVFPQQDKIYEQDTAWLRESDLLIGECTCPSLGVGYELAYAERFNKPCYLFYNKTKTQLSAMLTGNSYYHIYPYEDPEEIFTILDKIL